MLTQNTSRLHDTEVSEVFKEKALQFVSNTLFSAGVGSEVMFEMDKLSLIEINYMEKVCSESYYGFTESSVCKCLAITHKSLDRGFITFKVLTIPVERPSTDFRTHYWNTMLQMGYPSDPQQDPDPSSLEEGIDVWMFYDATRAVQKALNELKLHQCFIFATTKTNPRYVGIFNDVMKETVAYSATNKCFVRLENVDRFTAILRVHPGVGLMGTGQWNPPSPQPQPFQNPWMQPLPPPPNYFDPRNQPPTTGTPFPPYMYGDPSAPRAPQMMPAPGWPSDLPFPVLQELQHMDSRIKMLVGQVGEIMSRLPPVSK